MPRVKTNVAAQTAPEKPPRRYGSTEVHRRRTAEQNYPSSLTDAEWALVADLFSPRGRRGVPPVHGRRSMLDACCYVLRTGCARRMLPQGFPLWDNVYETFRRESAQGSLSRCIIACGRSAGSARRELSILGGWPGALVAQQCFRHKTRKLSYQLVVWLIIAAHQLVWID